MQRDSEKKTFLVATTLCLVCSVLVSTAAVALRSAQQENKKLDIQKNILKVAGVFNEDRAVSAQFRRFETLIINLKDGQPLTEDDLRVEKISLDSYDARKAAKDPNMSVEVSPPRALPQISRRELFAQVFQLKKEDGSIDQVILPIYGKGLWSTLYGFIAVDADGVTIRGITFYEHGETPGLGGEVDNQAWKDQWPGKKAFADSATSSETPIPSISVAKGTSGGDIHKVDGLSGATITSNGVTSLVKYWLGPDGFGPFLANRRAVYAAESGATGDANG